MYCRNHGNAVTYVYTEVGATLKENYGLSVKVYPLNGDYVLQIEADDYKVPMIDWRQSKDLYNHISNYINENYPEVIL